jgi:hypothetical protein
MKKLISVLFLFMVCLSVFGQQMMDKVPFKLIDGLIFIEVSIDDTHEPLNFIFDTGAGITVIDTKVAGKLGLPISGESTIGTSGKTLQSKISEKHKLLLGKTFKLDSISLVLMDLSHLSEYFKSNVDGVIGFDLLRKTITETNIDELEIRFYSGSDYKYTGASKPLTLIGLESNHIGLPIEIIPKGSEKSIMLTIKIDTAAANYLTFHNNAVKEYNLIDPKKRYKTKKGFGADSTIANNIEGKLSSAIFGSKQWKNIPVVFEVDPLHKSSKRQADGLIGQKMLLDFNITYNLNDGIVYLEKR